jgi:hypothetical protein
MYESNSYQVWMIEPYVILLDLVLPYIVLSYVKGILVYSVSYPEVESLWMRVSLDFD